MSDIKIRAKLEGDETTVKCLMSHPMETGLRKDSKTNEVIPAHFIREVVCKVKGAVVMKTSWSGGVSKNPICRSSSRAAPSVIRSRSPGPTTRARARVPRPRSAADGTPRPRRSGASNHD
jgi:thiosulfate oxidation carrier complex protein SoxZ